MSTILLERQAEVSDEAFGIYQSLPVPEYSVNYQPTYEDEEQLLKTIDLLLGLDPIVPQDEIELLQDRLTDLAQGKTYSFLFQSGACNERISEDISIEDHAQRALKEEEIVLSALPNTIFIYRGLGQNAKPRSNGWQTLDNGLEVPSYMGDMINGQAPTLKDRKADPERILKAAQQAKLIREKINQDREPDNALFTAHEALLLAYEYSFVRDGYLLTTHFPWVGYRTNDPDGPHVELLSRIKNPGAVKIGPNQNANDIKALKKKINPDAVPGRLTFMIRVALGENEKLEELVVGIHEHAPESIVVFDIHGGDYKGPKGEKIRREDDIKTRIEELGAASTILHFEDNNGFHGAHVETTPDDVHECIDTGQPKAALPDRPGDLDPGLNPFQLARIAKHINRTRCN